MKNLKSKGKAFFLLLILSVAGWFIYQPKHPALLDGKLSGHPVSPGKQLDISGIVLAYGSNHDGDIDKILLSTDTDKVWIHFPPHTARQVTSAAPIHQSIRASVRQRGLPAHHGDKVYELEYLRSGSSKITVDLGQIPAPLARKGFDVEVKGHPSKNFEPDDQRQTNFVLAGKLILLPPHMAQELLPIISSAKIILVKGLMRDSTEGFLSGSGLNVVKPSSIQIDSVTYMVR